MTTRLTVEYDGTDFRGWATQPGQRTVQGELERAIATVLRRPVRLTVAGRTDTGVHALANVASYDGEPVRIDAMNALLPPDVSVLASETAPEGFNARFDATSRAYCYRVLGRPGKAALTRRHVLHVRQRFDPAVLWACAALLPGTHDFSAFTPSDTHHVRFERDVFAARWERQGEELVFWIEADTFMRHMNRILVGTMLEAARGLRSVESFGALLAGAPRASAGATAPPHGLCLAGVGYAGRRVLR
jgi:tRNA pseudouridine38-40 synthase